MGQAGTITPHLRNLSFIRVTDSNSELNIKIKLNPQSKNPMNQLVLHKLSDIDVGSKLCLMNILSLQIMTHGNWFHLLTNKNSDDSISRYKARLVTKGFIERLGFDFNETFTLVVKLVTIRLDFNLLEFKETKDSN
ncbi:Reverse transcriptase [Theobroma cacao]|nr:Reverse transcriptase [Theobroma cacao]